MVSRLLACNIYYHKTYIYMEKLQQLQLMDKILRELEDLKNSQTAVLKKIAQIEADNINLNIDLLNEKLPDIHEEFDSGITIVTELIEKFTEHREDFFVKNNLGAEEAS